jgi:hypothetical protein
VIQQFPSWYIIHEIYYAFEKGHELRAVFLDISKAFDKVWHRGLLAKLQSIGINGPLLQWFESYLLDRRQRVTIEGENSDWTRIEAGVPQGSALGPLLFLIYINDFPTNISSTCFLFADDSLLMNEVITPVDASNKLNGDLNVISDWASRWLVTMNPKKTENIIFSCKLVKPLHPTLILNNYIMNQLRRFRNMIT